MGAIVSRGASSTVTFSGAQEVVINKDDDSIQVWGTDGSTQRQLKTDSSGELQVDVLSSALPTGAATSANQSTEITSLQLIDDLVLTEDAAHNSGDKGVMPLSVRQDTPAALASNGDYQPITTDGLSNLRTRAIPDRPSEGINRTAKHGYLVAGSGSRVATNGTVTNGKTYYVTSLSFSGYNSSTTATGDVRIRDGASGSEKIPLTIPVAGVGALASLQQLTGLTYVFPEPKPFTTSVAVDVITGTITYSMSVEGYEE